MTDSKPLSALICEDEDITAMHLRKALESAGYRVVGEAADGKEAIRLANETLPDLILMDVNMPVLSGIKAAEAITAARPVPIIMVTAYSSEETVNASLEAGAAAYLVKPVTREQLLPAIRIAQARFAMLMEARGEADSLRDMMETRKLIERAKGVVMQRLSLPEQDAFEHLQGLARSTRKTLKITAHDVIAADESFRAALGIGKPK
ncbi:MAG TPA: response regulator [Armatimonadota bacterium]|jgi:response regulator NasT